MTGEELRSAVTALGFNSELPSEEGFIQAANLTMERLRTIRPIKEEAVPLSLDTLGNDLSIDNCLSEAAVLLTAYYVWMEDAADKAAMYRQEYDYAVAQALRRRKVEHTDIITNNW